MGLLWQQTPTTFFHPTSGELAQGAKAYFYDENTSTPRAVYTDAALSIPYTQPVVANAAGYFPDVFIQSGNYRNRITTSDGSLIRDRDNISPPLTSTNPSDDPTPAQYLFQTGDYKWRDDNGALDGFVRCNGLTMGNASSGATERANADTADLFSFLWNKHSNTICPVSGGRGANAAADFAANKTITLLNASGRLLAGLDNMSGTPAGVLTGGTTLAGNGGEQTHVLTISELPSVTPAGTVSTPTITITSKARGISVATGGAVVNSDAPNALLPDQTNMATGSITTPIFTGTPFGSGTAHNNLQPYLLATLYMKL